MRRLAVSPDSGKAVRPPLSYPSAMLILAQRRTSTAQVPNLKLVQLSSAGVGHVTATPFYQSIPEESELIVCSASGIHVVPISEHGTSAVTHHPCRAPC